MILVSKVRSELGMDWHKSTNPFTALCKDLRILNSPPGKKEVGQFFLIKRKCLVKGFIRITVTTALLVFYTFGTTPQWKIYFNQSFWLHIPNNHNVIMFYHSLCVCAMIIYTTTIIMFCLSQLQNDAIICIYLILTKY